MKYLRRKLMLLLASAAFFLVYFPLRDFSFALQAATCAAFTVLVFGNAFRRRTSSLFFGDEARPIAEIALVHAICLASLIAVFAAGSYLEPLLPYSLRSPLGAGWYGIPGLTAVEALQSVPIFFLGLGELRYLTSRNRPRPNRPESNPTRWRKAALEEARMSRLRLP